MKYRLIFIFSIALLIFNQNISAQETEAGIGQNIKNINLVQLYDSELFTWNYNMFGGLSLNYQNQNSGISIVINETMKKALLEFPDSSWSYNSYIKKNTAGNVLMYGGLVIVLTAYIPMYNIILNNSNDFNRDIGWTIGLTSSGLISAIIGSFIYSSGTEDLFNAINLFNRNKVRELIK